MEGTLEGVTRAVIDDASCCQSACNATISAPRDSNNYLQMVISLCKSRAVTSVFTSDTNPGEYYPSDIAPKKHSSTFRCSALNDRLLHIRSISSLSYAFSVTSGTK